MINTYNINVDFVMQKNFFEKSKKILKKVLTNKIYYAIIISVASAMPYGSIAQLGEHLPYKQRVIGSSPIVSTKYGRGGCDASAIIRPGSSVG